MKIIFLTTGIGRGHLFYLVGLRKAMIQNNSEISAEITYAPLVSTIAGRALWSGINLLYRLGSREGWGGAVYNSFRQNRDPRAGGFLLRLLGRSLRPWLGASREPIVVDHPLLSDIIKSVCPSRKVIYMHGEQVAPREALSNSPDLILVPTELLCSEFLRSGVLAQSLAVTGTCVESSLVDNSESFLVGRVARIHSSQPLTVAFYSSGAEPVAHLSKIRLAVESLVEAGGVPYIFAKCGGKLDRIAQALAEKNSCARIVRFNSIEDEEEQLRELFPLFDLVVMPAHERINWALGLGMPIGLLGPNFGSFSPLNHELALDAGVGFSISSDESAKSFAENLIEIRSSGSLRLMNRIVQSQPLGFHRAACEVSEFVKRSYN